MPVQYSTVSSGQTSVGLTAQAGVDEISVDSGGTVSNTRVIGNPQDSDYALTIGDGGASYYTTVSSGGDVSVDSGQDHSATVLLGGEVDVVSGGTTFDMMLLGGTENVEFGGSGIRTSAMGGSVEVLSASVVSAVVGFGGVVNVDTRGLATSTSVDSGGVEDVESRGSSVRPIVSSGGTEVVLSGGLVSSATILSGGTIAFAGGTSRAPNLTASSGATVEVSEEIDNEDDIIAGTLSGFRVSNGVAEMVYFGGTARLGTVASGGIETILSGGSAASQTVLSGGTEVVSSAGIASNTTVMSGGLLTVFGQASFAGVSGGTVVGSAGGLVLSSQVTSAGLLELTGGVASAASITGAQELQIAGASYFAVLKGSGSVLGSLLATSGLVSATTVSSGGLQHITALATGSGGLVAGGTELVDSGGATVSSVVTSSGAVVVGSGGQTSSAFAGDTGNILVSSGGIAYASVVTGEGFETVFTGGSASSGTISGGGAVGVSSGGVVNRLEAQAGGNLFVYAAGSAFNTTEDAFALMQVAGLANVTSVLGGNLQVLSGGLDLNTILSGGTETVMGGGTADMTLVGATASQLVDGGTVTSTSVQSGGSVSAHGDGTSSGFVDTASVGSGGLLYVLSGGFASGTVLSQGAFGVISSGGVASRTQILDGGTEKVSSGGASVSAVLTGNALQQVFAGGSSVFLQGNGTGQVQVSSGGALLFANANAGLYVTNAGTAANVTVSNAAVDVQSGGTDLFTTLLDGGGEIVREGGKTSRATVSSGGAERLEGGTANTAVVLDGGVLAGAGLVTGTLTGDGQVVADAGTLTVSATVQGNLKFSTADGGRLVFESTPAEMADLHVTDGGVAAVLGGNVSTDPVEVDAGGVLTGYGTVGGGVTDNGAILADGGALTLTGAVTGAGQIGADASGQLTLSGAFGGSGPVQVQGTVDLAGITGGQTFDFSSSRGLLWLHGEAGSSTLSGFSSGSVLDFAGQSGLAIDVDDGAVTVMQSGGTVATFALDDVPDGTEYAVMADATGGMEVVTSIACYRAGTSILTPRGEVAVEALEVGDTITTASGAHRPIRWIGTRTYAGPFLLANPGVQPIRFHAGALGQGLPRRDLLVSPEHAMFLDGVLIPAKLLVNGETIVQETALPIVEYVHVELDSHDVLLAEGAPCETFVDCDSRGMFHNAHTFSGDAPRWSFCAPRVEDGPVLARIRDRLCPLGREPLSNAIGHLDWATHEGASGWVWLPEQPGATLEVELLVDGSPIARVTANAWRPDVRAQGIGTGRYGFRLTFARALPRFRAHVVSARAVGGGELIGTVRLDPAAQLDPASLPALAASLQAHAATPEGAREVTGFLLEQLRASRGNGRRVDPAPLALVLDDAVPRPGRDAGSAAVTSHMDALQRLGYAVVFVPLDGRPGVLPAGVACAAGPEFSGVEDALRHHGNAALVYVHRVAGMALYGALIRHACPGARLVYAVADLHFLRLARQAAVEGSAARMAESRRLREQELAAARFADATLTHSSAEAELLRRLAPGVSVRVVPWHVPLAPAPYAWRRRSGLLFVGSMAHAPNADALRWLASEVMPRVAQLDPRVRCKVVGAGLTDADRAWLHARMDVLGPVADLSRLYRSARVAMAPLRFGAGVKGKVLEAFAAGLPCVMTPVAAEGLALPEDLRSLVAEDADAFARLVVNLHADPGANMALGNAGRPFVMEATGKDVVEAALGNAVASARAPRRRESRRVVE